MKKLNTFTALLCSAILSSSPLQADELKKAIRLYEDGMLVRSQALFDEAYKETPSADALGWAVLTDVQMQTPGYVARMDDFLRKNPHSPIAPQIKYSYATNLFDSEQYEAAAEEFAKIDRKELMNNQVDELIFCQAYCDLENNKINAATDKFLELTKRPVSDYSSPAQ